MRALKATCSRDCEFYEPYEAGEADTGYPGDPGRTLLDNNDQPLPRSEWCPTCIERDRLKKAHQLARRRLLRAIA